MVPPKRMGDAVARAAERDSDVLLVYFIGHGLVSSAVTLHLAARSTDYRPNRVEHTALPYETVRRYVRSSQARTKIVVLDCCSSGLAVETLGNQQLADLAAITGSYVLTSAGPHEAAFAPSGQRHTTFTGALLRLLADGDPAANENLTLDFVHSRLETDMRAAGLPTPLRRTTGRAGELALAPNPAFRPAPAKDEPAPDRHDAGQQHQKRKRRRLTAERIAAAVAALGMTVAAAWGGTREPVRRPVDRTRPANGQPPGRMGT